MVCVPMQIHFSSIGDIMYLSTDFKQMLEQTKMQFGEFSLRSHDKTF